MKVSEWKERYIAKLVSLGMDRDFAGADYEAGRDDHEYDEEPENSAGESLSYYGDGV